MSRQLRPPYTPKYGFDLSEVTEALKKPCSLDTFLEEVENKHSKLLYKRRTQGRPGSNWDENF